MLFSSIMMLCSSVKWPKWYSTAQPSPVITIHHHHHQQQHKHNIPQCFVDWAESCVCRTRFGGCSYAERKFVTYHKSIIQTNKYRAFVCSSQKQSYKTIRTQQQLQDRRKKALATHWLYVYAIRYMDKLKVWVNEREVQHTNSI